MKSITCSLLASAAIAFALVGVGQAQDAPKGDDPFAKLDKNGDGKLEASEVPAEQKRFFDRLIRVGDKNADGVLTREEFAAASKEGADQARPTREAAPAPGEGRAAFSPEQIFSRMDTNGDGKLSADDKPERGAEMLQAMLKKSGKDSLTKEEFVSRMAEFRKGGEGRPGLGDPAEMFKRMDANGDGKLSKDEAGERLKERFEQLDANKDGSLDPAEIKAGFAGRPGPEGGRPGAGDPEAYFKKLDANGDGKVTKDEAPDRMKERFDQLDANKDGSLELGELKGLLGGRPGVPGPGRGEFLQQFDANKDGKLSREEAPEKLKALFEKIDADKDGFLTPEELRNARPDGERPPRKPAA